MTTSSTPFLEVIQSLMPYTAARRSELDKPKWKDRFAQEPETKRGKWSQHRQASLTYEHAVPLGILHELLFDAREDISMLDPVLDKFFQTTWVTEAENRQIDSVGLRSKMPADWDGFDRFARYEAAGIVFD